MLPFVHAVEEEEDAAVCDVLSLHEACVVCRRLGKDPEESLPSVMVPHHEVMGDPKVQEQRLQDSIGVLVSPIAQVPREHAEIDLLSVGIDIRDAAPESTRRIESVEQLAAWDQMNVADVNKSHGASFGERTGPADSLAGPEERLSHETGSRPEDTLETIAATVPRHAATR